MTCKSCGRDSLNGEDRCADCQPMNWLWPRGWLTKRLEELRDKEKLKEQGSALPELMGLFVIGYVLFQICRFLVRHYF